LFIGVAPVGVGIFSVRGVGDGRQAFKSGKVFMGRLGKLADAVVPGRLRLAVKRREFRKNEVTDLPL
jgi:hypothetical protein